MRNRRTMVDTIESVTFLSRSARDLKLPSGDTLAQDAEVSQIDRGVGSGGVAMRHDSRRGAGRAVALLLAAAGLAVPAWTEARAQAGTARDLCIAGQRAMEAGDLAGAKESFRAAGGRVAAERAEAAPLDEDLLAFLSLHLYNLGVRFNNAGDAPGAIDCFVEEMRLEAATHPIRAAALRERVRQATLSVSRFLADSGRPGPALEAYDLLGSIPGVEKPHLAAVASRP